MLPSSVMWISANRAMLDITVNLVSLLITAQQVTYVTLEIQRQPQMAPTRLSVMNVQLVTIVQLELMNL